MDTRKAVAKRIMELCDTQNITIHALARLSAVPPSTLKNIIHGGSQSAGIVNIKKICDGFEITLGEFFSTKEFDQLEQEIK